MGVNLLADRPDEKDFFFLTPTLPIGHHFDSPGVFSMAHTILAVYNPGPPYRMPATCDYMLSSMPGPLFAVVMIGKGTARQGQTQIGRMVGIGKPSCDQTKSTMASCRAGVRYGNGW